MTDQRRAPQATGDPEETAIRPEDATDGLEESAPAPAEPQRDIVAEAETPASDPPAQTGQGRRLLAAVFWLLASLAVLFGGVALWAHQTLLTADGWGGIVEDVIADEEVVEAVSMVVVERLGDSLGIGELVADVVPGPDIVSGAITAAVQTGITDAVIAFASSEAFEDAFVNVNEAAHEAAMRVIRGGDSEALTSEEGVIALNLFPLIEGLLVSLQDAGVISERREIPDLAEYEPPTRTVQALETLLGRDIPDDVGTIVLVESENLDTVQTVVRWFDLITIVLLLLWAGFTALALWLAERRIRMVLWLSGGAIAALLAGRFVTRLLLEAVFRRQPELEARVVVSAIIEAAVDSLMWFTFVLIAVAVIVAIAAYLWERRDRTERMSMQTPPRTLGHWIRDHALVIVAVGAAIIGVLALWSVGGPGIPMLTAAALLLLAIAVKVLSDRADEDAPSPPAPSVEG
ncbi:MAG: hypothetical protein PVH07_04070 [Chloroflexota bacterium]|jgi:hypothetical protein